MTALPSEDLLRAPFDAFARLDQRSAQALLSGTMALFSASRASRGQLSERIRDVRVAIECLCEPAPSGASSRQRWERLAQRLGVWADLANNRAYSPTAINDLQQRLVDARNIGTHGADAALIDLGWSGGDRTLRRGRSASANDLSTPALQRDLGPMLYAVGEALRAAWYRTRVANFDDEAFESLFAPTTTA